jgi:hypothetical protein
VTHCSTGPVIKNRFAGIVRGYSRRAKKDSKMGRVGRGRDGLRAICVVASASGK